jgi:hypothetical protein
VIDVGFGQTPLTTLEWQQVLPSGVEVVGVEVDAVAVDEAAREAPGPTYLLVPEGQALPGPAAVVRAFNVLRGTTKEQAATWEALWREAVAPTGLFLEGSTDTEGHVGCWAATSAGRTRLVFYTDGVRGTGPWLFRDWLPRRWRRDVREGTWVHRLLSTWAVLPGETFEARGTALSQALPEVQMAAGCVTALVTE